MKIKAKQLVDDDNTLERNRKLNSLDARPAEHFTIIVGARKLIVRLQDRASTSHEDLIVARAACSSSILIIMLIITTARLHCNR